MSENPVVGTGFYISKLEQAHIAEEYWHECDLAHKIMARPIAFAERNELFFARLVQNSVILYGDLDG